MSEGCARRRLPPCVRVARIARRFWACAGVRSCVHALRACAAGVEAVWSIPRALVRARVNMMGAAIVGLLATLSEAVGMGAPRRTVAAMAAVVMSVLVRRRQKPPPGPPPPCGW